ncbi:MAG: hypothetical protein KC466_16910, partial [Myxococcales bacterium]|nr:hypothetical protein [Myxococcales bacterium]
RAWSADEIRATWSLEEGGTLSPPLALSAPEFTTARLEWRGSAATPRLRWRCRGDRVEWSAPFAPAPLDGGSQGGSIDLGRSVPWLACAQVERLLIDLGPEARVEGAALFLDPSRGP